MTTSIEIQAQIDKKHTELDQLQADYEAAFAAEQKAKPVAERVIFSAKQRCQCGAGLAYDTVRTFKEPVMWSCSDILCFDKLDKDQQAATLAAEHDQPQPFDAVVAENTPPLVGSNTRERVIEENSTLPLDFAQALQPAQDV